MAGFPVSLFITLAGVTLLFGVAETNGTLDVLATRAARTRPRQRAGRADRAFRRGLPAVVGRPRRRLDRGLVESVAMVRPGRGAASTAADRADGGERRERGQPVAILVGRGDRERPMAKAGLVGYEGKGLVCKFRGSRRSSPWPPILYLAQAPRRSRLRGPKAPLRHRIEQHPLRTPRCTRSQR